MPHAITADQPGRALELRWQAGYPGLRLRLQATLALVLLGLPALAWGIVARDEPAGPAGLLLGGFVILYAGVSLAGLAAADVSCLGLRFDREAGTLTLRRIALVWLPTTRVVPLEELVGVKLSAGPERAGAPLELVLSLRLRRPEGHEEELRPLLLAVEHLDRRLEALDLLCRIARIAGFPGYLVPRSDPRRMVVELVRRGKARRVPDLREPADYAADVARPAVFEEPPGAPLAPFDPAGPLSRVWRVSRWEPGRRVELDYATDPGPAHAPVGATGCVALVSFGLGAFFGGYLVIYGALRYWVPAIGDHPVIVCALAGAAAAVWGGLWTWRRLQPRRVRLDWEVGRASFQTARRAPRELALSEVEEVVLRGVHWTTSELRDEGRPGTGRVKSHYRCDLILVLPGPDELIFESDDQPRGEGLYRAMLPMAVELARALDRPWRWEEFGQEGENPLL